MQLDGVNIGIAITGSFCTFDKIKLEIMKLVEKGANVLPIFHIMQQRSTHDSGMRQIL